MLLNPLAVLLLGQLFILLLVIVFYQRLQKKRLLKDLTAARRAGNSILPKDFSQAEVTDLLNELGVSIDAATDRQQQVFNLLGKKLGLQLDALNLVPKDEFDLGIDTDELVTQVDIDEAIAQPEPLDELEDMLSFADDNDDIEPEEIAAAPAEIPEATADEDDSDSVDQLNAILEEGEELDEFDLDAIEGLETSEDSGANIEDELGLELDDDALPEDTLQAAIDEAASSDFTDLEKALEN